MPSFEEIKAMARRTGQQANMYAQNATSQFQSGFNLPSECNRAAKILRSFLADPTRPDTVLNSIPKRVLLRAKGLAIFTVAKAGFGWSAKAGSGVVTARLPDGSWSAPSCIATGGVGFGWQIGADLTEFVVVMNTEEAVRSFGLSGNMTFGGNMSAAAGPIGRGSAAMMSVGHMAPMFSYSRSKGLYVGISLEGTALMERKDANREFYGQPIPAMDLLLGKVPAPEAASAMYEVIEAAEDLDETAFLRAAYPNSSHRTHPVQNNQEPMYAAEAYEASEEQHKETPAAPSADTETTAPAVASKESKE